MTCGVSGAAFVPFDERILLHLAFEEVCSSRLESCKSRIACCNCGVMTRVCVCLSSSFAESTIAFLFQLRTKHLSRAGEHVSEIDTPNVLVGDDFGGRAFR